MKKQRKQEILERESFLKTYSDFDSWLRSIGFRSSNIKESMSHRNYHYSHYDEKVDSLYSVENYIHDVIRLSIHFLRDRNEHKLMFVGSLGRSSEVISLDEAKEFIREEVLKIKNEELSKLNSIILD